MSSTSSHLLADLDAIYREILEHETALGRLYAKARELEDMLERPGEIRAEARYEKRKEELEG